MILIVDDNLAVLKLLETLYQEEGFEVRKAQGIEQAKQFLDKENWEFDLVVTDINMPGGSGFDLLEWIKRKDSPNPHLPVLMSTAELPEAEYRIKGLALGAVDYIVRPIELKELVLRSIHAIEYFKRLKSLRQNLESSENLAMIGRVLAAFNHEIKNVANMVKFSADRVVDLCDASKSSDERLQKSLKDLHETSHLMSDIAKQINSLIGKDNVKLSVLNIDDVITETIELMRLQVRPSLLEYEKDQNKAAHFVLGNKIQIKQILINLILNAQHAICALKPEQGGHIVINLSAKADQRYEIRVIDNGIGIKPEDHSKLFTAFYTTKELQGGQGLGLWLSQRLARNMQGDLSLTSDGISKGAQAVLTLKSQLAPPNIDLEKYFIK